ncbi:hypothetical protein SAMN04487905_10614 [Actinopolyspora xinjiangensis]|uniref:Uncharacterized protein n=1 Tax=Actinopolyspora xinjiangensis TaxID=405564 RepID=A0A1H0U300_9ACTN|nr:hypothetical protein [Actinopolyspora xinjiangensis]SDP60544.1 hypothetical protein SAMN04487905_10614 [Actinopolyspora xinjiangensis]
MPDDNGGVTISATQMYTELQSVHLKLTEIASSLENLTSRFGDHETRLREIEGATVLQKTVESLETKQESVGQTVNDHESRLRTIERRIWTAIGITIALSALASGAAAALARTLIGGS